MEPAAGAARAGGEARGHRIEWPFPPASRTISAGLGEGVGPAIDALRCGGLLLVDELDASLHPTLTTALVELFEQIF